MMSSMPETTAIHSTMGADPDFAGLVEMYVDEMPGRIEVLEQAFKGGNMEDLCRIAHQVKGAAGSYGFDPLTPLAAALETSVRDGEPEEAILKNLQDLLGACRQVRTGSPA